MSIICCPVCNSIDPNTAGYVNVTPERSRPCRNAFHCPAPDNHGTVFRLCPYCDWTEPNLPGPGKRDTQRMDSDAQSRLEAEALILSERIIKLEKSIYQGGLGAVGYDDGTDLLEQLSHMRRYHACLLRRMSRQQALLSRQAD